MARKEKTGVSCSSRFDDAYEVYVDYGKGRPVRMNNTEATFLDVKTFLTGKCGPARNDPTPAPERNSRERP